jgi:hydroxyacylglutathione hydrolase
VIFRQYYLGCLSHASYLIGDETSRRAVVVDPQRDVAAYLADLDHSRLALDLIIETHFHADFVSGHLELAAATGAAICFGPGAEAEFPIRTLRDGDRVGLGEVYLEIRATPGHTPESISVVVYEHAGAPVPYGVLTGDTLFIGDVGRPDLAASSGFTADVMARQLYHSLHAKLLTLPDATRVYPAHGAGSACGKNLSTETWSTIGEQRHVNYALAPIGEEQFVAIVTEGQPSTPAYFSFSAQRNRKAHNLLGEDAPPPPLQLQELVDLQAAGAVVLDTRSPSDFAAGHLRGAINVGLEGRFAEYAGDVLAPDQAIALWCDPGTGLEAKVRLGRIGFDGVVGALNDPIAAMMDRSEAMTHSSRISAADLARLSAALDDLVIVDVRGTAEREQGAIAGSTHMPLAELMSRRHELEPKDPIVVYCASGYRSSIASSFLSASGCDDVTDLLGGFEAWTRHRDAALAASG